MPVNKAFPLAKLLPAVKTFSEKHGRMITLEFILIEDINDSLEQAKLLRNIALDLHAHVNLIPYNSVEGLPWKRPSITRQERFADVLRATAVALAKIKPDFVSVTYGAGGSTQERSAQVSAFLRDECGFTVMPHLTCVGHSRAQLSDIADRIHESGFRNIMTLRGDPPSGTTTFVPYQDGLRYASDLVALLKSRHPDFCLGVGGYPEKHPEAATAESDLANLKRKVDAGASFITT